MRTFYKFCSAYDADDDDDDLGFRAPAITRSCGAHLCSAYGVNICSVNLDSETTFLTLIAMADN